MAKEVLFKPYVMIDSVDLSDHIRSISVPLSVEEVDSTCGGDTALARLAGMPDWSFEITFAQDFASSEVDATLGPIALTGEEVVCTVRKSTESASATNPAYSGSGRVFNYDPISGTVGDLAEAPVTIKCSNGTLMTRATS